MIVRGRYLTGWLHLLVGLFALAAVTADCAAPVDKEESRQEQERAKAMLTTAHAHEVSMFGEPSYPTEMAWSSKLAYTLPTWGSDTTRIAYAAVHGASEAKTTPNGPTATPDIWMMAENGRGTVHLTDGHTCGGVRTRMTYRLLANRPFQTKGRLGIRR